MGLFAEPKPDSNCVVLYLLNGNGTDEKGTSNATPTGSPSVVAQQLDRGYQLVRGATIQYITAPHNAAMNVNNMTIMAKCNPTDHSTGDTQGVIVQHDQGVDQWRTYGLWQNRNSSDNLDTYFFLNTGTNATFNFGQNSGVNGKDVFLVATYDGSYVKTYMFYGATGLEFKSTSTSKTGTPATSTQPFLMGTEDPTYSPPAGRYTWQGKLDLTGLWNRAWNEAEVRHLYGNMRGRFLIN